MQTQKQYPDFSELAIRAHKNAKEKGFWDNPRPDSEVLILIISEIGEAVEAHRKGKFCGIDYEYAATPRNIPSGEFSTYIKDTFEDELADTCIRILDYAGYLGLENLLSGEALFREEDNLHDVLLRCTGLIFPAWKGTKFRGQYFGTVLYTLFAYAAHNGIDLLWHIEAKMNFNQTREHRHGKKY